MVKNLILIRHADAIPQAKDERDFQRVLSKMGQNQAILLADYLRSMEIKYDTMFISPAARAKETAKIISENLSMVANEIITEEYYEATLNTMKVSVNRLEHMHQNVIFVGHNPSMALLSEYLTGDQYLNFATAACAIIEFEIDQWSMVIQGSGILKDFYYPGKMGAG